jgi:hypothetical protein
MSKENSTTLIITTEKTHDDSSETKQIGRLSSSGRPRSLGQVNDQLLVNPGIEEVDPDIKEVDTNEVTRETEDKSAIESLDEEQKDDAKKTKKGGSSLVAALPDKSGRCDHFSDENQILRCKVIACFRNVAHCYN